MQAVLLYGLAGFLAQFINGTLGMGYGMTSTTALLISGTTPAIASASAHFALVGTSLASGVSHWSFGNVDWRTVGILAIPGAVGAGLGAFLLVSFSGEFAAAWISVILFVLGLYVLARFAFLERRPPMQGARLGTPFLAPLGLVAGFIDATGGGGWGPVATTTLLSSGRLEPRKVVGSVSAAEFAVTVAASVAFLFALSLDGMNFAVVIGLLAGGVLAAPCGAWLVRRIPAQMLGIIAGGLIILTNGWLLLTVLGAPPAIFAVVYCAFGVVLAIALHRAVRSIREERRIDATAGAADLEDSQSMSR